MPGEGQFGLSWGMLARLRTILTCTLMGEMLCPNCHQELVLPEGTQSFDFIFMSRVQCQECGASIIIEDDVPRLPRDGEPD